MPLASRLLRTLRFSALLPFLLATSAAAQSTQEVPFDSPRWEIRGQEHRVEEYLGRQSLKLRGGFAIVRDADLTDGVIEFDMAFPPDRGFKGALWRYESPGNWEEFYVRPHQSGNPDANQYTPAFFGNTAWQLYYGEGYGAPVRYQYNTWTRIRIVVAGKRAEVYIGDMTKPALVTHEMKRSIRGGPVGVQVANFSPAWYSRFRFTPMSTPPALVGPPPKPVPPPAGAVMAWRISDAFDEKSLETKFQLSPADQAARTWTTLPAESSGITNLASVQPVTEAKNTAFARITITSDRDQVKKIRFGFSDRVKVYFNGTLLYGGQDNYTSRDYRFLGTMGLFDELYLPLKRGENELWFAISEDFGGWGIIAHFPDASGIAWK